MCTLDLLRGHPGCIGGVQLLLSHTSAIASCIRVRYEQTSFAFSQDYRGRFGCIHTRALCNRMRNSSSMVKSLSWRCCVYADGHFSWVSIFLQGTPPFVCSNLSPGCFKTTIIPGTCVCRELRGNRNAQCTIGFLLQESEVQDIQVVGNHAGPVDEVE